MYKLLIADDERIIRESIYELIDWASLDIQITACCKNGLEALNAIIDTAPDIVMTDIRMPGIDGLELIDKIRSLDSHIRFIILTGYPEFEYARRALHYGVQEYLLKPISEEAIIEAVKKTLISLSVSNTPLIGQLVATLLENRSTLDCEYTKKLLNRFFSHFAEADELRPLGFNLLIELNTRFSPLTCNIPVSQFTEKLLTETDFTNLCELITNQALELLFTPVNSNISIADTVKSYVLQHLDNECLSLKYIAENLLFINVNYLSRTFAKQSGEKFSNYLNRTRIEKAQNLFLKTDNLHIHKVAEAVGFGGNPQYFSQVFKKYTNLTPSQYIESVN